MMVHIRWPEYVPAIRIEVGFGSGVAPNETGVTCPFRDTGHIDPGQPTAARRRNIAVNADPGAWSLAEGKS
jgi:hypothetical protein